MSRCAMEPEEEKKKKLNDDVVVFLRKRSDTETPRYTARLKTYVDFQHKRHRAETARRHSDGRHGKPNSASRKKIDGDVKDKGAENKSPSSGIDPTSFSRENPHNEEDRMSRTRGGDKGMHRARSMSRSGTGEPEDACCGRRRRRKCPRRRRRRRSCRKRRRRSCRRRRRRSSSRRRRRRSCRRKRRRRACCGRRRRR